MENNIDKLLERDVSEEIKESFLDYSMSVIVSRALPDVRDGLKPVHRRIIYAMNQLGVFSNSKHLKSAKIVGDVMGDYHPHGDSSIYDAMVRMAQKFSYRYKLVDGHGNFGSIDGDGAAAMRYTEAKMSKLSMEMIRDINKDTVNFIDNYDGRLKEPEILPSRYPNILVNGATGIAVGMATNIPPHNLGEVIDGTIACIDNPEITILELMEYIKGPDFPTGATILGNSVIKKAYETGKGIITIRSKAEIIEAKNGKQSIIITEIPYQINKSTLINRIAELVRDKVIEGIADLRDESNKGSIKIVIEAKKEGNANVILNNLYKHTALQTSYGINLLALVDGEPRTLSLKEILTYYLAHQKVVIIRRCKFELAKAEKREHILEGLKVALDHIDEVIKIIRAAKNDAEAKETLNLKFSLSEIQTEAILEMKLRKLTGLERNKIEEELTELLETIKLLKETLSSDEKIYNVIKEELLEIKSRYQDERLTKIDMSTIEYIEDESLIPVDNIIITLTNKGYIKRLPVDTYKVQNRGGVGIKAMTTNEEDFVEQMINATTHDYILFFTNKGKVYRMKGYGIPEYNRQAKGIPIINLLPIDKDETINSILKITKEELNDYLIFGTKYGLVKRTQITEFDSIRNNGKISLTLKEDDELIGVKKTDGNSDILMASSSGRMVRFNEKDVRIMGRTASGVRGINLTDSICVGIEVAIPDEEVLVVTEEGYGKKTPINEYRTTNRGSKGVKTLNITDKNGAIVSFKTVNGTEDIMIMTNNGITIRVDSNQISTMSRVTQGIRLINLKENQRVATIAKILKEEEESSTETEQDVDEENK